MTRDPVSVLRTQASMARTEGRFDCAAEIEEAIAQVEALVKAAREASATLGHAYHTTLSGQLAEYAHTDYQRLDSCLAPFKESP
jgi:hypothetical protein